MPNGLAARTSRGLVSQPPYEFPTVMSFCVALRPATRRCAGVACVRTAIRLNAYLIDLLEHSTRLVPYRGAYARRIIVPAVACVHLIFGSVTRLEIAGNG
jgi:hypothetical protein